MTFTADRAQLPDACEFIQEASAACGFDDRTNYACQLAVCEAVENIFRHGYRAGAAGKVHLSTEIRPGELTVEIVDSAPPFDPTRFQTTEWTPSSDPEVGGRGLLMIRRVMDVIGYERRGNQNVLRLTKNRPFTGV